MKKLIIPLLIIALTLLSSTSSFAGAKTTLTWTPPTTLEDGTPLTDLKGFRIYWSLITNDYSLDRMLDVGNVTTIELDMTTNLNNNYFFVATAYRDALCISRYNNVIDYCESENSNEISKYVDGKPKIPTVVQIITD